MRENIIEKYSSYSHNSKLVKSMSMREIQVKVQEYRHLRSLIPKSERRVKNTRNIFFLSLPRFSNNSVYLTNSYWAIVNYT